MVKVVSWNIGKREKPWRELVQMASEGAADVALLQEAGSPPGDVVDPTTKCAWSSMVATPSQRRT